MSKKRPISSPAGDLAAVGSDAHADGIEYLEIVGESHVTWRVVEVAGHEVPGTHGEHCLLFIGEGVIRRVWEYPPEWKTLGAKELARLSWQR